MTQHTIIYVPGLGDHHAFGQNALTRMWQLFGVRVIYFPLGWSKKEPFDLKLNKLLAQIDELTNQGYATSLVGVSAGASAVLNAFSERKNINGVVCICGKVNNPQNIGQRYFDHNPAFKESVFAVSESLHKFGPRDRARIMSIHPVQDQTVPPKDAIIKGAVEYTVPAKGHIPGIYYCLLFTGRTICNFLKSLN